MLWGGGGHWEPRGIAVFTAHSESPWRRGLMCFRGDSSTTMGGGRGLGGAESPPKSPWRLA